jgi:uncharacterized membrane protein YkvA (DUF1232 family)
MAHKLPDSHAIANARYARGAMGRPNIGYISAFFRFLFDFRASIGVKFLVFLSFVYVFVPVDLIPDLIPIVGWLDDLGFVAVALGFMARTIGKYRTNYNEAGNPQLQAPL